MKKFLFTAFILLAGMINISAQDLIVNKKDKELKVKILAIEEDGIRYNLNGDSYNTVYFLPMDYIKEYKYNAFEAPSETIDPNNPRHYYTNTKNPLDEYRTGDRYKAMFDISFAGAFVENSGTINFGLATSQGRMIGDYFFLGVGIGVNISGTKVLGKWTTNVYVPLFAHTRAYLSKSRIAPYIEFQGGYTFKDLEGGLVSPGLGVSFPISSKAAIDFSFSYMASALGKGGPIHSFGIGFGFEF